MLKRRLVPIAPAARVAAHVEHRRKFRVRLGVLRQIKIPSDVETGATLEVNFFNAESFVALDDTCDLRLQRSALGHWPQPEHFEILLTQFRAPRFPLRPVRDAVEELRVEAEGLLSQKIMRHLRAGGIGAPGIRSETMQARQ